MDSFEKRIRVLFSQCRRGGNEAAGQSEGEFLAIRKDYYKALEDADEKVQLANQMYDLVDRYLRRLDSELFKFKCELEADHNGITEILEKRSLELDGGGSSASSSIHGISQKENRYFGLIATNNYVHQQQQHQQQPVPPPPAAVQSGGGRDRYGGGRPKPEKRRDSSTSGGGPLEKRQAIANSNNNIGNNLANIIVTSAAAAASLNSVRPSTPTVVASPSVNSSSMPLTTTPAAASQAPVSYSLQHIGAGNAIAAAASQAIAATQQMQQGRRTASLKASYEAIHGSAGNGAHELLIGRELTGAAIQAVTERDSTATAATNNFNNHRRHKK